LSSSSNTAGGGGASGRDHAKDNEDDEVIEKEEDDNDDDNFRVMEGMIQWVTKNFQQFGPLHFGKLKHHNYYYVPYNNNNNNNNNGNLQKISSCNRCVIRIVVCGRIADLMRWLCLAVRNDFIRLKWEADNLRRGRYKHNNTLHFLKPCGAS
jgi:hypothetical protein